MNRDRMNDWVARWVRRHPLRTPPAGAADTYARDVMARIAAQPSPAPEPWWRRVGIPQLGVSIGVAAAGLLIAVALLGRAPARLAGQIDEDWQWLARAGDAALIELPDEPLEQALEAADRIELASADGVDDAEWLDEALELLELQDEPSAESDDDSLDEQLQWLDALTIQS